MPQPPLQPPAPGGHAPLDKSRKASEATARGPVQEVDALNKKRKYPKTKLSAEVRRSASTPHIRELAQGDSGSAADKRRNKLGYQRTSIACSHCRRRKIRCLLPIPEDSQGRCANCIRLKKECNFYPVDHPSTDLRTSGVGSKDLGSATLSSSATSSPRTPALHQNSRTQEDSQPGLPFEQPANFQPSEPEDGYGKPSMNGGMSPRRSHQNQSLTVAQGNYPASYPYSHVGETEGWVSPGFSSHAPSQAAMSPYWTSSQSTPATTGFPPNPLAAIGHNPSPVPGYGSPHIPHHSNGQAWVPTRSASYSQIDTMPTGFHYTDLRSHSDAQTHPLNYHIPNPMDAGNAQPSPAAEVQHISSQIMPSSNQPLQNYTFQQPWPSLATSENFPRPPSTNHTGQPMAGPWYTEPTTMMNAETGQQPNHQYPNVPPFYPHTTHPV